MAAEEKQMARRSWENTCDDADKGTVYPGLFILNRWRIACDRHLDDLRHETGALEYSNVRAKIHYDPARTEAGPVSPSSSLVGSRHATAMRWGAAQALRGEVGPGASRSSDPPTSFLSLNRAASAAAPFHDAAFELF